MEDLKPMEVGPFSRTGGQEHEGAVSGLHILWIPSPYMTTPLDQKAVREAAREAGQLWLARTLHRRLDKWWEFLFVAKTDAARQSARTVITALAKEFGRQKQRDEQSRSQPQKQVIAIEINVSPGLLGSGGR